LGFFLFFFSCTLFVLMPSMMATLYTHTGLTVIRQFAAQYGSSKALAGVLGTMTASLVLFLALQNQPQTEAFALLNKPPKTDAERTALLAKSDRIQAGLLNAYLAQYRYVTSEVENDHIQRMYQAVFGLSESAAKGVQATYNRVLSPFLYWGSFGTGPEAEKLYEQFFDTSIQKGERDAVNHALQSTWNRDEAKAGLLNFNQRKVWLKSQAVTVKEQGDWAEVELHEVYENQTFDLQEVFYSFDLPESAVITGLWLGDTDDLAKRFPFVVSPRGAAQQVYTEQVQQRVDPALLEQVGPRHYRLRAFPIPAKMTSTERSDSERSQAENGESQRDRSQPSQPQRPPTANRPTHMHLWLTYQVMQQPEGWPLPHLGEKRNLFWTDRTERLRNGKSDRTQDAWLEAYLPASPALQRSPQQTTLPDGFQIAARPLAEQDYVLPKNQRFAIVLDSSRSMGQHSQALNQTFQWLQQQGLGDRNLTNNEADLFITAPSATTAKRLDHLQGFEPAKQVFYGSIRLDQMLKQFTQARGDTTYDGILLVTDEGSYELAKDKQTLAKLPAPLWMVHLGALPPAYDDAVLKAIEESGGGVGTDLPEVLRRQATKAALGTTTVSVADGYAWSMTSPPPVVAPTTAPSTDQPVPQPVAKSGVKPSGFDALAARQLILGLTRQQEMANLANLDRVHAIAQRFQIVSPYSSMIVLVNDAQREALKRAEKQGDRFQREVESGKEEISKPFSPMNSAVPEPSTWAGIGLVILGFLGFKWKHRRRENKDGWEVKSGVGNGE
jgi:putative PEP-CTERM system integral membrane protein